MQDNFRLSVSISSAVLEKHNTNKSRCGVVTLLSDLRLKQEREREREEEGEGKGRARGRKGNSRSKRANQLESS